MDEIKGRPLFGHDVAFVSFVVRVEEVIAKH